MKIKDIIDLLKNYVSEMEIDEIRIEKNHLYIKPKTPVKYINVNMLITSGGCVWPELNTEEILSAPRIADMNTPYQIKYYDGGKK